MPFFKQYYPLIIMGAILGVFALLFLLAYALIKNKKESIGFDRNIPDREIIKRLLKYAKPYWKGFVVVLLLTIFSIVYDVISPWLIGEIQGMIKTDFSLNKLYATLAVFVSILLVTLTCSYAQAIILQKIGQKIVSNIRMDLFEHIEKLSHNQLHHTPVGKLVTRVSNDTSGVSMMFTFIIVNLVKNSFMIIGVLAAMLCLNYTLTLMVLCFVPFVVFFTYCFRKFSRRAYRRVKDSTTDINTFLSENLSGMKITQFFNREQRKLQEFSRKNNGLRTAKHQQVFVFGVFRPLVYMLYIVSVLALFLLGAKGALDGKEIFGQIITSEVIVAFYLYISKFFNPIQSLAEQFNFLQSAFASAEKIFTVMDMQPEVVDAEDAIELQEIQGKIEFKNVWFAYEDEEWILRDVSFVIDAKQTVALVGATGSGKTTILSLICRNYDIQKGQILIDGIDVKKIKIASLRKHFGQMLQDVFLFSGTIRQNIVLREDSISDDEVWQACKYVHADSFISKLSKGLDYEILENGNNFSAGQRQLISFARAIVHDPKVIILDEATANIDTETEQLIQHSLEKMMSIGTMIIVAHRLSTVQHADKIIVLSHGQIIEEGTHFELLKKQGSYYQLYTLQSQKESLSRE